MKKIRVPLAMLAMLLAAAWLITGCSDDDPVDPGGETQDTTAPEIVEISPGNDDSGVATGATVTVTFSEAMAADSETDQITLSSGTITDLTWSDDRTLTIGHEAWAEGAAVTLTVGVGLTDTAGNHLATAHTSTFYIMSTSLVFQASVPVDGAEDVNRSAVIKMLFSGSMDLNSLATATTVTNGAGGDLPFMLMDGEDDWVLLNPVVDLPADDEITVTVSTAAQDQGGRSLDQEATFAFTTGQDVDVTPPTVVSWEPANGATLDSGTTYFRMTFSEPMSIDSVEPVRISAAFAFLLNADDRDVLWSENNTVMTVPLPTPLPAGLPIDVTFQNFADANGVVQDEAVNWSGVVAGEADYYPLVDERIYEYVELNASGPLGEDADYTGIGEMHIKFEAQSAGVFHRKWYDAGFVTSEDWDIMQKTGSALELLGFHETDDGDPFEVNFDTPLTFVALPPAGTWTDVTTATVGDMGTVSLEGNGEFVEQADLEWVSAGPESPAMFWKDVRLVVIEHRIFAGETTIETGIDSLWLAPTVGLVESATYNEDPDAGTWDWDHGVLMGPGGGGPRSR